MAAIDDLINQITDGELRVRIAAEISKMQKGKKFGLVFENHLPECTPLYDVPVTPGKTVAQKNSSLSDYYKVLSVENGVAECIQKNASEPVRFSVKDLVVIATFGEPIYPYLQSIDSICNAPDSDLWHTLIEADNYHALQLLDYLYHGKVDCIYIDPPYNTGAKDWKYNNNYVDASDAYRHSKWLSFMEKRLSLAKKLLNPKDSVLIVTIDEKEYLHLGCLLEEMFPEANIQMVSITINPSGAKRDNLFSRADEFAYIVLFGNAHVIHPTGNGTEREVRWFYLRRTDYSSRRGTTKGGVAQFFPIYVNDSSHKIIKIGNALSPEESTSSIPSIKGATPVFPIREDGVEMNWGLTKESLKTMVDQGLVRISKGNEFQPYIFKYLSSNYTQKINSGRWAFRGFRDDGTKIVVETQGKVTRATTVWKNKLHDAGQYGTSLIKSIIGDGKFNFPKSLYSVHDTINYFIKEKTDALIVDFFAGSGTTLHAVNLLNAEDGGQRRCIMVTNNEVSEDEAKTLRNNGCQPGDTEWENLGIARYVTWPRTKFSIKGVDINGNSLKGEYFTTLKKTVEVTRNIKQIALNANILNNEARKSILALIGKENLPQSLLKDNSHYIISEKYSTSIIFDLSYIDEYLEELNENGHIADIYIVTDNNSVFKKVKQQINELMGLISKNETAKLPMSDGFAANCAFFKLGFLDKTAVSLGKQFKELLPLLWLKAGAVGPCPELKTGEIPAMLILPQNHFAVLVDENYFSEFKECRFVKHLLHRREIIPQHLFR